MAERGERSWHHPADWRHGLAIGLTVAAIMQLLALLGTFERAEQRVYDSRLRVRDSRQAAAGCGISPFVVIVDVPSDQLQNWRRGYHRQELAALIDRLAVGRPAAIVVDAVLEPGGAADSRLAAAMYRARNVVLRAAIESPSPSEYRLVTPPPALRSAAAGYGYALWSADPDGLVRRFAASLAANTGLGLATAAYAAALDTSPQAVVAGLSRTGEVRSNVFGSEVELTAWLSFRGPPGEAFRTIDYARALEFGVEPPGAVVVIGSLDVTAGGLVVPLSHSRRGLNHDRLAYTSGTELLATAIDTLREGRFLVPAGLLTGLLVTLLAGLLGGVFAACLGPASALFGLVATTLLYYLLGDRVFNVLAIDLPLIGPLLTAATAGGIGLYRRLHAEIEHRTELAEHAEDERRRLAELDQAKRAVLSTLVHDLKVPVTIIKGQALTLLADPEINLGRELHEEFLTTIAGQCDRLTSMVEDILDTDPASEVNLRLTPVNLAELAHRVVEMHEASNGSHQFRLVSQLAEPIAADADRLTRVLNNLVSNAVKYSPSGGEVTVTVAPSDEFEVMLAVRDEGIGMTPEQVGRLFQLFTRVLDDPGRIPGTGVGLYSAKRLVEAHGGRIEVSSTPGAGSEFRVYLPVRPANAASEASP